MIKKSAKIEPLNITIFINEQTYFNDSIDSINRDSTKKHFLNRYRLGLLCFTILMKINKIRNIRL